MKGVVEKKKKVVRKEVEESRGGGTRQPGVCVRAMKALYRAGAVTGSRANPVDTAGRLALHESPSETRGGNAEVHSHYIQTIQCQRKATQSSAMNNV